MAVGKSEVAGFAQLLGALDGLAAKAKKSLAKKCATKAGQIVAKKAKSRVPRASGLLKKSIGSKVKTYRGGTTAVAVVGPRVGMRTMVMRGKVKGKKGSGHPVISDPSNYGHLVELGHRGSAPRPFLAPALHSSESEIVQAMADVVVKELLKGS